MDFQLTLKKTNQNKSNLKRSNSVKMLRKPVKKDPLKQTLSSVSLAKNTLLGSTFCSGQSKPLQKKLGKKKSTQSKKNNKDKQNIGQKKKSKQKTIKSKKTKIQELTDRKKMHMEFFMYKDTYLPIENTQQRKFVYRINLIDQRISSALKSFRHKQTATQDEALISLQSNIKGFESHIVDSQCQTESQNDSQKDESISQEKQKCFISTLSELQFLYLPDEKNFEGFTKSEKAHYKELLTFIAKKFENENINFDQSTIEGLLSERQLMQRGLMQSTYKPGIPTHTPSILSYISNLLCFIEIHQKIPLIDRINCNYGYSILDKLSRVKHGLPTGRSTKLISQSTFWKFEDQLHGQMSFQNQNIEQSLHYHNKAIFDCVNEFLEYFQPYFSSRGEPFPWNYNFQTTFYCITEETYNALGCQIKEKVWEACSILAGLILEVESEQKYKCHIHRILLNERNMLMKEVKKIDDKVEIEQFQTRLLIDLEEIIKEELMLQFAQFLM